MRRNILIEIRKSGKIIYDGVLSLRLGLMATVINFFPARSCAYCQITPTPFNPSTQAISIIKWKPWLVCKSLQSSTKNSIQNWTTKCQTFSLKDFSNFLCEWFDLESLTWAKKCKLLIHTWVTNFSTIATIIQEFHRIKFFFSLYFNKNDTKMGAPIRCCP